MTDRQKQLIENYIRLKVKKMMNEAGESTKSLDGHVGKTFRIASDKNDKHSKQTKVGIYNGSSGLDIENSTGSIYLTKIQLEQILSNLH